MPPPFPFQLDVVMNLHSIIMKDIINFPNCYSSVYIVIYVLVIPRCWDVYGWYTLNVRVHEHIYTSKRQGTTDIYAGWAFKCSYGKFASWVLSKHYGTPEWEAQRSDHECHCDGGWEKLLCCSLRCVPLRMLFHKCSWSPRKVESTHTWGRQHLWMLSYAE